MYQLSSAPSFVDGRDLAMHEANMGLQSDPWDPMQYGLIATLSLWHANQLRQRVSDAWSLYGAVLPLAGPSFFGRLALASRWASLLCRRRAV
jgi:hypothetical protein